MLLDIKRKAMKRIPAKIHSGIY